MSAILLSVVTCDPTGSVFRPRPCVVNGQQTCPSVPLARIIVWNWCCLVATARRCHRPPLTTRTHTYTWLLFQYMCDRGATPYSPSRHLFLVPPSSLFWLHVACWGYCTVFISSDDVRSTSYLTTLTLHTADVVKSSVCVRSVLF